MASHRWPWQFHWTHRWPCMANTWPPVGKVIQNLINGHRLSTEGRPLATGGNWLLSSDKLVSGMFKCWKKMEKFCRQFSRIAIKYSGKAIKQSKKAKLYHFWKYRCRLVSNDAAGWINEHNLRIRTFWNVDLEKSAMNVILLSSKSQFQRTISTQNYQCIETNPVKLLLSQIGCLPSCG